MLRLTVNDTQYAELRQVARQAVGRVSERAHFVQLSRQGYSPPQIAKLMEYDEATVRKWLKSYGDHGVAGLYDAPRSGRPRLCKYLAAVVQAQAGQPPRNYGYLQACWTVGLLLCHLRDRFHIAVSRATLRQALRRADFRWSRPKLVLPRRPDPMAEQKRAKLAQVLADPSATVIAEDECDMHLLPVLRAMWQRVGQQFRVVTPGQNAKRAVFGALDLRTGRWFYELSVRKRGIEFIGFMTRLLAAYPTGPIYVIVDNASIHTSHAVRAWLAMNTRLQLVYLPTYAGHKLNPVEKIWWALKDNLSANYSFRRLADLDDAIRRYFVGFTWEAALRLANSETVRTARAAVV
jgi:transposase